MTRSIPSPDTQHRHTFDADYYRTIESNTAASSSTWPSPPPSPPPSMYTMGGQQTVGPMSSNHHHTHHYHHQHSPSSSSNSGSDDDLDVAEGAHPVTVVFEEPNWVEQHLRKTKAYAIAQQAFDHQEAMEAAEAAESEAIGRMREQQA